MATKKQALFTQQDVDRLVEEGIKNKISLHKETLDKREAELNQESKTLSEIKGELSNKAKDLSIQEKKANKELKKNAPVVMNIQGCKDEVAKRFKNGDRVLDRDTGGSFDYREQNHWHSCFHNPDRYSQS